MFGFPDGGVHVSDVGGDGSTGVTGASPVQIEQPLQFVHLQFSLRHHDLQLTTDSSLVSSSTLSSWFFMTETSCCRSALRALQDELPASQADWASSAPRTASAANPGGMSITSVAKPTTRYFEVIGIITMRKLSNRKTPLQKG
jgi:hypothetical protein